ncbi:ABC transporter ATP-binding protein [Brooklawnia cerclae]|uniref:ABC-type dipeptide/oligopeptide/nickel transport system ATPase component n=1 Tax=Brooklawnia cerclae TaxID=349934 RepID=A0ABX0SDC5_9ACTN|nr:ABC transporter ATP-binding protein [Brooklawnia cerclae]NIH56398.1 ABC-type dipeptide/oligopeptide/nickel transport system ATPase component [Brooklawnia cerclae]
MSLLRVDDLTVRFGRSRQPAVERVGFSIEPGERVGLIGESGSGKSVTALAIMGLLADTASCTGSIRWHDRELIGMPDAEYSRLRGEEFAMVFQEPMTALDPTMPVGRQVAEVLRLHEGAPPGRARGRVCEMLSAVGLPDAERVADSFPHQLSGGQRQRVLIAMSLINTPELLICDEPTTALDVTVQARVLELLRHALDVSSSAMLFISHDLAVVSQMCDRLLVMYRGSVVEEGAIADVLARPSHPYTAGLIATADIASVSPGQRLPVIDDFWDVPVDVPGRAGARRPLGSTRRTQR